MLLCIVMVMSFIQVPAYASEGSDGSITISSEKTTLKVGETTDVTFQVNAKSDAVGAVNFTVIFPSGLEYVSHEVLVASSDYMMSSYNPADGKFGCAVTILGKTGTFNVLKLTVKAKDSNLGNNSLSATIGDIYKVDGSTTMNFGSIDSVNIYTYAELTGTLPVTIAKPVVNQAPVTTLTDTRYSGTITWDPAVASGGNFAAGIAYTANVTLTARDGYQFANDVEPAVTDATISDKSVPAGGKTLTFNAKFPVTGSLPAASVTAPPAAKSGLKYNGTEQDLLDTPGTADGGDMQYSLDNNTWGDAIPKGKNAGDYTVYYKVKGNSTHSDYTPASNTVPVKIDPKSIADTSVTIASIPDQTYTGSAIEPPLVVKDGGTELKKGTDYTVSYANNTNAGTATLTINGTGNYTGTKSANFTINAKDVSSLTADISDQTTIYGVGEFVDPVIKGVKGEDLTGNLTYAYGSSVSGKSHAEVVTMLKTKAANDVVDLTYTFTPTPPSGNYTGTKIDSFKVTVKDIEFLVNGTPATVANTLTFKTNPTYGDDWSKIVKIKDGVTITAKVGTNTDTVQSHFTLKQTGKPGAGSQAYTLSYNGTINGVTYSDVTVVSGNVTVAPRR